MSKKINWAHIFFLSSSCCRDKIYKIPPRPVLKGGAGGELCGTYKNITVILQIACPLFLYMYKDIYTIYLLLFMIPLAQFFFDQNKLLNYIFTRRKKKGWTAIFFIGLLFLGKQCGQGQADRQMDRQSWRSLDTLRQIDKFYYIAFGLCLFVFKQT